MLFRGDKKCRLPKISFLNAACAGPDLHLSKYAYCKKEKSPIIKMHVCTCQRNGDFMGRNPQIIHQLSSLYLQSPPRSDLKLYKRSKLQKLKKAHTGSCLKSNSREVTPKGRKQRVVILASTASPPNVIKISQIVWEFQRFIYRRMDG